jgi:transposase
VNPEQTVSFAEMERMMKVQEVILKAMAGSLKWWEAAEIIGVSDRTMRRWRERYQKGGYDGLYDRRKRRPSPKRVPLKTAETVLQLYREKYFDFNVRHFHEKLSEEHGVGISYTWVKLALQGAGLVKKQRRRGTHRRRRPRRPLPGMLLHIDASKHAWFGDGRYYDLITILDDATSEIYYATGGGGRDADADAGGAGSDRAGGDILRALQRPGEPLFCDAEGGREGR